MKQGLKVKELLISEMYSKKRNYAYTCMYSFCVYPCHLQAIIMSMFSVSLSKLLFQTIMYSILFIPVIATAQLNANISRDAEKKGFVSLAGSYGQVFERDAHFFGFSGEYSRRMNKIPIGIAGSLMWDQETDVKKDKVVGTFTAAITGSYLISKRWSVGSGLGKGFMDTDNTDKNYKFTSGDWSTALFFGYQIPLNLKSSLGISASYEYNISGKETSFSIDLSYGINM